TEMTRLPGAIFIVDTTREHIAVKEAQKLKIPIFAMVDTNSDPRDVDFVIPSNDDASKSIEKILSLVSAAVAEGLGERKKEKEATSETDAEDMEAAAKQEETTVAAELETAEETPEVAAPTASESEAEPTEEKEA
ncbi:MAG: 30S ribosomal protein S2, partial [Flavobacteriaceae bacterium]